METTWWWSPQGTEAMSTEAWVELLIVILRIFSAGIAG